MMLLDLVSSQSPTSNQRSFILVGALTAEAFKVDKKKNKVLEGFAEAYHKIACRTNVKQNYNLKKNKHSRFLVYFYI